MGEYSPSPPGVGFSVGETVTIRNKRSEAGTDPSGLRILIDDKGLRMSDAKVSGVVHLIEDTKTFGTKGFRKRLVVIEQDKGSFTNYIPIEFVRDSCDAVDDLSVGDEVEVTYRLTGRRWQRDPSSEVKYFLSAEAMSFKLLKSGGETMTERVSSPNDALAEAGEDEAPF